MYCKIITTLLFVSVPIFAQQQFRYSPEAESLFIKGIELFEAASFENAAEMFELAVNINPIHQRTTASYIMGAKSWLNIQEQAQAMFLLNNLLKRFPESEYAREAHFTLGTTYFLLNEYKISAKEFLSAMDEENNDKLSRNAGMRLDSLVTYVLTGKEAEELIAETQSGFLKQIVERNTSGRIQSSGQNEPPREPVIKSRKKTKVLKVGILLPLLENSGPNSVSKAAKEMLEGITLAQEQSQNSESEIGIDIVVKDTERDSLTAKKFTKEFASDKEIIGIIGPLFSNTTQACAPIANAGKIPLITPIANTVGIAASGEYIFQANADVSMHGKALAQYAMNQLGLTTFAVISPRSQLIASVTSAFVSEVKRRGGTITAHEEYDKSSDDLNNQFISLRKSSVHAEPQVSFEKRINNALRKRIIKAGAPASLVDSLIESRGRIFVSKLFGKNGLRTAEALNLTIISPHSAAANVEMPVTSIQGMFVPVASSDDIGVIASQMVYYNIKTQLLGTGEWYDESQLETQRRYANGVIFCSDYFFDENDSSVISLQQQLKKRPTKYTLFGYDAMRLVLSCIEQGARTREQIREALSNIQFWEGVHSTVTLKGGRVNRTVQILQFRDGEVRRVGEVTVE